MNENNNQNLKPNIDLNNITGNKLDIFKDSKFKGIKLHFKEKKRSF